MFYWSQDLGTASPVDALQRLVATRLAASPGLALRLGEAIEGHIRPYDFVPTSAGVRWVLADLLHGNGKAVRPLLEVARRRLFAQRQHRLRQRLARRRRLEGLQRQGRLADHDGRPAAAGRQPPPIVLTPKKLSLRCSLALIARCPRVGACVAN
jgi:hypothetical protein